MYAFILSIAVLAIDQFSKLWIAATMKPYQSIPVVKNVFHLTYLQNTGAAFSMLRGQTVFFAVFTSIVVIFIIIGMVKLPLDRRIRSLLALVLGGALGNLIDRIRLGYVIDFFDFRIWPVFNVADCAVVVGIALISILIGFDKDPESLLGKNGG